MDVLTRIVADGLVVAVVLVGAITYLLAIKKDRLFNYSKTFMAGITALTIGKLGSLVYDSGARPFVELGVEPKVAYLNNPGFPSDHALFVATITFVVWAATHKSKTSLLLAVLSLLVSIGRIVGLVHSPVDVIGAVAAAFIGVWVWYGNALFKKHPHKTSS